MGKRSVIAFVAAVIFPTSIVYASSHLRTDVSTIVKVMGVEGTFESRSAVAPIQTAVTGPLTQDTGVIETQRYLPGRATAQARAEADYGILRAWAGATACGWEPITLITGTTTTAYTTGYASASAKFFDSIIITSPGVTGSGKLGFLFHVDGSMTGNTGNTGTTAGASWFARLNDDFNNCIFWWDDSTDTSRSSGDFMLELPIVFGQKTDFSFMFAAIANANLFNAVSVADYFNTVTVTGLSVKNSVGNTLDTFTAVADSGHDYTIPEPATLLLLGLGGLLLRQKK